MPYARRLFGAFWYLETGGDTGSAKQVAQVAGHAYASDENDPISGEADFLDELTEGINTRGNGEPSKGGGLAGE